MRYKDYEAVIEQDESDRLFFGRVINTEDIIVFDGLSVDELEQAFKTAIEQYLMDGQPSIKFLIKFQEWIKYFLILMIRRSLLIQLQDQITLI